MFDGSSVVLDDEGELVARAPRASRRSCSSSTSTPSSAVGRRLRDVPAPRARARPRAARADPVELELGAPTRAGRVPAARARAAPLDDLEQMRLALELGLRDYVRKNGFGDVVIGLSGGIDSALTAAIAVGALGAERVHGVSMPSRYSSEGTQRDARRLAESLGIDFREIPIEPMVEAFGARARAGVRRAASPT